MHSLDIKETLIHIAYLGVVFRGGVAGSGGLGGTVHLVGRAGLGHV